ncbi:FlaD/FlaE family flagellar protein [Salinarchaeum laminariae]|uniref:FlaD/FlaE family flagellar protein n=1 Tax=Salinarchaeum laminariae TaxID=869888 RepID=UPI0020C13541|nr:FlaD/FlaE family flagellar protein [Salinarchaeum laminariae]
MGNEAPNDAAGLLGTVLSRLGGEPENRSEQQAGATSESSGPSEASDGRGDDGRPLTDGGAEDAPIGDSPWAEDDPIVFGDDADTDHGDALLDAVTDSDDEAAPPFSASSSDEVVADVSGDSAGSTADDTETDRLDSQRLDELEARIGALESDHVQLETSLSDVAAATTGLQTEVETVGTDVRQLVTMLGGLAVASAQSDSAESAAAGSPEEFEDAESLESRLDDALDGAVESVLEDVVEDAIAEFGEAIVADAAAASEADGGSPDDGTIPDEAAPQEDPVSPDELPDSRDEANGAESADGGDETSEFDVTGVPEGIHRGAGEPPTPNSASDTSSDTISGGSAAATDAESGQDDAEAPAPSADVRAEESTAAATETGPSSEQPSRDLVDPRTEAVGARLRQFREGFVDDPTADLPTGNTADEFRFEKILLPTDGAAAPDLSADELAKPYLETLPDGYAADAVVLEWLDWLVSAADCVSAAHAVGYYESIDWVTEDVRADLLGYLDGLGQVEGAADSYSVDEPPEALDLQDHLRSLQYVTELASGEVGADGI